VKNKVTTLDKNYSIFTTDIVASESGSGVLINTKGELIGMVMQSFSNSQDITTLTAISISELGTVIDRLTKAQDVPYVGLYISTINKEISEKYQIPKGVFIKEVLVDSPAMYAGLQSGDVITHVNGESIYADATYTSKIEMLLPGTTCEITVRRQSGEEYIEIKCEVTLGVLQ
jgi:serine protease Do